MINIDKYPILSKHKSTLRKTSKDGRDKNNIAFMTESRLPVINFDAVAKEYARIWKVDGIPSSNDAMFITGDKLIFIEFKNVK